MRIFGIAALLSLFAVVGCALWYEEVTSGNGPNQSVDLRPLGPIFTALGALTLIWLAAGIAWIFDLAARQRRRESDGS